MKSNFGNYYQLTGWKIFPIKLYDKTENEIPDYHGFSVVGCCGPTDYEKSEIVEKVKVPNGPICKFYKGVFIKGWDGSDFFTPKGTYEIFITEKSANVLKKAKLLIFISKNWMSMKHLYGMRKKS